MALANAWLAANQGVNDTYADVPRWGDGTPEIFSQRGGAGRGTADAGSDVILDESLVGDFTVEDFGYSDEDSTSIMYGYGVEDGTADRPSWDPENDSTERQATLPGYPHAGYYVPGIPGGVGIRSIEHGAILGYTSKATPEESAIYSDMSTPQEGQVEDAVVSDPSQYEMQTSMTQRDKTRAGSQSSGTASEYDAPIRSRITGQRLKNFDSNPGRHYDMAPKEQAFTVRPFWNRTAGTGKKKWMETNEMYVSTPQERVAPENPYPGNDAPALEYDSPWGYQAEDVTY